jgi:hypothetical protein
MLNPNSGLPPPSPNSAAVYEVLSGLLAAPSNPQIKAQLAELRCAIARA